MGRHGSPRARYAAPFAIVGAIAIGAALPSLSSATPAPRLPQITVRQLIAKADSPHIGAFQGTVGWTANLGLPDIASLAGIGGGGSGADFDWASLASGTHAVKVWSDADQARLALIGSSSEIDLYANASSTWVYDSVTNTATHLQAGATGPAIGTGGALTVQSVNGATPQALGQKLLANLGSITDANFDPSRNIAGQPAYVVSLTPRVGSPGASATTLRRLTVAVDAKNGMILQAALYSTHSTSPAFEVGYSSIDLLAPGHHIAPSEFAFSPGPGVKVTKQSTDAHRHAAAGKVPATTAAKLLGSGWGQVLLLPTAGPRLTPTAPPTGAAPLSNPGLGAAPPSGRRHSFHPRTRSLSSELDTVTTAVSGSWGQGRLLSTNLLNVLFLSNGDIVAGFVTAPTLEAAAASAG